MNEINQEKLFQRFNFFDLDKYGITCGNGWYNLINELCVNLESLNFKGKVLQIKEKFGGLRFYCSSGLTEEQYKVILEAEEKSYTICECCGKPGKLRKGNNIWIRTLCDKHNKQP